MIRHTVLITFHEDEKKNTKLFCIICQWYQNYIWKLARGGENVEWNIQVIRGKN